jgi:hypothetical protein
MHEQEFFDRLNHGGEDDRRAGDSLNEEDQATESLLKVFEPAASGINRDRLMYLAGRASALAEAATPQPSHSLKVGGDRAWIWPAATAVMSAISLALAIALLVRPAPSIADRDERVQPAPSHRQEPQAPEAIESESLVHDSIPVEGNRVEVVVHRSDKSAPVAPSVGASARRYLEQRELALQHGVDALPVSAAPAASVARVALPQRKLLDELLPAGVRETSSADPFGEFFSWPSLNPSEDNL